MTEPPIFEDWNGDVLRVIADKDDVRLAITSADQEECLSVDIPPARVREVTSEMHACAGLSDRWALLKDFLCESAWGRDAEEYRAALLRFMDGMETRP